MSHCDEQKDQSYILTKLLLIFTSHFQIDLFELNFGYSAIVLVIVRINRTIIQLLFDDIGSSDQSGLKPTKHCVFLHAAEGPRGH